MLILQLRSKWMTLARPSQIYFRKKLVYSKTPSKRRMLKRQKIRTRAAATSMICLMMKEQELMELLMQSRRYLMRRKMMLVAGLLGDRKGKIRSSLWKNTSCPVRSVSSTTKRKYRIHHHPWRKKTCKDKLKRPR